LVNFGKNTCYKSAYAVLILFLLNFCAKRKEVVVVPEIDFISDFAGTYSGYAFPNEIAIIKKTSNRSAKAIFRKDSLQFIFDLNMQSGDYDTSGTFYTKVHYFYVQPNDSSLLVFHGGAVDFDSIRPGNQNAKLSRTRVFGDNYSFQFSGQIFDTMKIDRTFSKQGF